MPSKLILSKFFKPQNIELKTISNYPFFKNNKKIPYFQYHNSKFQFLFIPLIFIIKDPMPFIISMGHLTLFYFSLPSASNIFLITNH